MRKSFKLSLLTGLAICGCQIQEPEITDVQEQGVTFTAIVEDGQDDVKTRSSLDSKGNVRWKKGDQVSIFYNGWVNYQYQVTDASDGKTTAVLNPISTSSSTGSSGSLPSFIGGTVESISNNVAYYPYSSGTELAKDGSSYLLDGIELPATQTYAEGSFGNGSFPMVAVTSSVSDLTLKFKNILGGIKFQLKGSARIASISLSGNADEVLCGAANVTVSTSATPTIELTDADAKTVTLDCGTEGVQLNTETATSFIIALPPMTMASGFTATVTDTYGRTMEIKSVKSQEIRRSGILKMPVLDYTGTVEDYNNEPFTITSVGSTTVAFVKEGSPADITLEYRTAGSDWSTYTIGTEISLTDGALLQFRAGEGGNASFSQSSDNYYKVSLGNTGTVNASGNAMSLLDKSLSNVALPENAFYNLFYECKNLVDASNLKLPANELSTHCYDQMFRGCASLTSAPELPATTLASCCYAYMFGECTSLTTAPELPALTLTDLCYHLMFNGCSSLTAAPELHAESLAYDCYDYMFAGCRSLTIAPDLPATNLAFDCYNGMFRYCTSLTSAPALPATTLTDYCYDEMFMGCVGLTAAPDLPATTLASQCYDRMFYGCTGLTKAPSLPATTMAESCYQQMFQSCTGLTSAPELPATTLASQCYDNMFNGCTSLTKAPALPATTMAEKCYHQMFEGCTGLTTAPELPATALAKECYQMMFKGCTGVTSAPELPATTLTDKCYNEMFRGCSGLTAAPELPAENLAKECYSVMFRECTGLTTAPALPATTLADACYYQMFDRCSNLTTAPELPATTLTTMCYDSMFFECSSLAEAPKLPAETMAVKSYCNMFYGCKSLTEAPSLPATTLANTCYHQMFAGCTGLTSAPALPATTLANDCYKTMFYGCTGLTSAPELPATDLADRCYEGMFQYCSNLNHIKALFTTEPSDTYTKDWVSGVASDGTFVKNSAATWDVTGTNGVPEGWTVSTE